MYTHTAHHSAYSSAYNSKVRYAPSMSSEAGSDQIQSVATWRIQSLS